MQRRGAMFCQKSARPEVVRTWQHDRWSEQQCNRILQCMPFTGLLVE